MNAPMRADGREIRSVFLLTAALLVTAFVYRPGLTGSFHFDDPHNLEGLARVTNVGSAVEFIASGGAGPLGRPLALALFSLEAYAWPHAPEIFLYTNVCLHLLNGTLVVWMIFLLASLSGYERGRAAPIAVASGAVWMLMPLLASSSLLIVQRMTLMSAGFLFAGFVGYLYGRKLLDRRPLLALAVMSASVVAGSVLAAFSKENGVLLPLFVLVAESTVLARRRLPPANLQQLWKAWRAMFLIAPTVLILAYLALRFRYSDSVLATRDFSAPERLLTQAQILWEYLRYAFLPVESGLGPFHDDYPVRRDWLHPIALLAVSGWGVLILGAIALRKKAPLLSFAVGWYLVGHVLESTVLPLELYFEHRNYVPLAGPVFALIALAWTVAPQWRGVAQAALFCYVGLLAIVLFNTTTLWGRPLLAAEMWAIYSPDSRRAIQYLAVQYEQIGDRATTRRVLATHLEKHPEATDVSLQLLGVECLLQPDAPHSELLKQVERNLATSRFEYGVLPSLDRLYIIAGNAPCRALDRARVYDFAKLAATNPAFQAHSVGMHNLHLFMAKEAIARRDLNLTMRHINAALSEYPQAQTAVLGADVLLSAGLHDEAKKFLQRARGSEETESLLTIAWKRPMSAIQQALAVFL